MKERDTERLEESTAALAVTEAHLTVMDGERAGSALPCGARTVVIGSDADVDLSLPDSAVSGRHAQLAATPGGLVLRDLDSTNGTFVGEVRVREAYVQPGSVIKVGRTSLRLELKSRTDEIPPSRETRFGHLVGRSHRMRQLFAILEWVAPTEASVLITGPSGTGKEMVARSIHEGSPRASGPLVVLDCGSIDASLVSSELFGHEAGAFTGAVARRAGVFEAANGGTVFLDEVGELPLELQPKLLRALDNREVRRLGSTQAVKLDVRVLAATNRPLKSMVAAGAFREDLFYRLCQLELTLPGLAERREDIPMLVDAILAKLPLPKKLAPDAMAALWGGTFSGNVRQLKNIVERAAMVARGPVIEKAHLMLGTDELGAPPPAPKPPREPVQAGGSPDDQTRLIVAALAENQQILWKTAQSLGIALNTLKSRMKKLGIPFPTRTRDH